MSRRRGRAVSGVLLLDKPSGLTSNQALQTARRLFNAAKAGHTGTLDPLASGLLPLCFGEATKVSRFLLGADKGYRARLRLGVTTRTGDSSGEVLRERPVTVDRAQLEAVLRAHTGELQQVPPMYSALKRDGERLYVLARRGETVEREPRTVHIARLELREHADTELELDVDCSKGTYVRTLAEDIGEALGCGAHLTALRRVRVGDLTLSGAVTLEALAQRAADTDALDACLTPLSDALSHLPQHVVSDAEAERLRHGQPLSVAGGAAQGWVAVFSMRREFLGMVERVGAQLVPRRLVGHDV